MQLSDLTGLGKVRIEALRAAGIISLRELLYFLPKGYKDTTSVKSIADLELGEAAAVRGYFLRAPRLNRFKGMSSVTVTLKDETGQVNCVWFNQPWLQKQLDTNNEMLLYGRMEIRNGKRQLTNPSIEKQEAIIPIYKALPSLPSKTMATLMAQAIGYASEVCRETLPSGLRQRHQLCDAVYAVTQTHFPESKDALKVASRRMAFEKALLYHAGMAAIRGRNEAGVIIPVKHGFSDEYWKKNAFSPTKAQRRVLDEILKDMGDITAMSRLVQGDVGCGKTAVAFGALVACAQAGFQGAMMAPTEILAAQHYQSASKLFGAFGIRVGLLTGSMRAAQRREALEKLATGEWQVVFGTHALISKDVAYQRLGLVVTDEQHRFGVSQRTALIQKTGSVPPNVLVMSATPIPRTLALILYGDLDISVIDELPEGRIPIETRIVPEQKREGLYDFVKQAAANGRQTYIVCPLVEQSESMEEIKAAQSHYAQLKKGALKGLRVGLTYGGQPQQEKDEVLKAFAGGQIDVLVATTVIEVGVNVPNATIMIIEDAHRFGLSQLHQLRGRVGRGSAESWCFLLSEPNERLKTLCGTTDGFVIAQKDLELRGPGELIGMRQHGHAMPLDIGSEADARLIEEVRRCCDELSSDPLLKAEKAIVDANALSFVKAKLEHVSFN